MKQPKPMEMKALIEKAKTSRDQEAYKLLEKTTSYRIGVGARTDSQNPPSFFIEVIVRLSTENDDVNLTRLEKNLHLLKALQMRGYSLTYQDDNSITCEKTIFMREICQEYTEAKITINGEHRRSRTSR